MSKRLEGKIVIVTGAGRGVGRGVALAMAISCNVSDQEQVKQTLDTVVENAIPYRKRHKAGHGGSRRRRIRFLPEEKNCKKRRGVFRRKHPSLLFNIRSIPKSSRLYNRQSCITDRQGFPILRDEPIMIRANIL
ncbi:hypothetical protein [Brevibacillus sp. AY1]|uniref:hypothetical protein n=1 Tax=Brevibacillus sp. AY1 TaxID=2807621 RepID=UPI00245421D6|nr:hypothetical protein [Brevibacillus sp. AY1]MDH4616864.1 hypothetical protein [Brevibacillus sp. AY1]